MTEVIDVGNSVCFDPTGNKYCKLSKDKCKTCYRNKHKIPVDFERFKELDGVGNMGGRKMKAKYDVGDKVFMIDRTNNEPKLRIQPIYRINLKPDGFYYTFEYYDRRPVKEDDLSISKEDLFEKYEDELATWLKKEVDYCKNIIDKRKEAALKAMSIAEETLKEDVDVPSSREFITDIIGKRVYTFSDYEDTIPDGFGKEKKVWKYSATTFIVDRISIIDDKQGFIYHPEKGLACYANYVYESRSLVEEFIEKFNIRHNIKDIDIKEREDV